MVSSWLHHFPIVACPGIHLGRRGVRQVQQPAQQPQQRQGAGAFGQRAQVPEEGNHQAWGFGWNIGGIIVGKSADYDQEYSEYIFKKIGLVIKYSEYNHGIVGIIWHNWLGTI